MQTRSRVFDDLAKVAGGAVSTLTGLKAEIEVLVRQQIERLLIDADMVPRDEFDAVKEMAANARSAQEALEKRVLDLEKKLGIKTPAKAKSKTKSRTGAKNKTQAKKRAKKKSPGKGKRG
jgi:BMFP domain-containing protein YqiC